jgi:TrmH family RNA methyltransferase
LFYLEFCFQDSIPSSAPYILQVCSITLSCRFRLLRIAMITSPTNSRIKEARKLQRRRERYAQGQMLIEGLRLVRDAWLVGATLQHLFYAPEMIVAESPLAKFVEELAAARIELVPCSASVFATLTETVTPQGIAAVVALPTLPVPTPRTLTLLLDQVRDPGNAGTLLRSAAAAGVELVIFGPETVDPFNEKVLRSGMGAHFRTPIRVCSSWEELSPWLDASQSLYVAEATAQLSYDEVEWSTAATVVVGGEATGASPLVRQQATAIRIPMGGETESLNAAVAGSVILFEAARQRRRAKEALGK